jgi:hypothetical protein
MHQLIRHMTNQLQTHFWHFSAQYQLLGPLLIICFGRAAGSSGIWIGQLSGNLSQVLAVLPQKDQILVRQK